MASSNSSSSEEDDDIKTCTIKYKKETKTFDITKQLTPEYLTTKFGLITPPKFLEFGKKVNGQRLICNPGKQINAESGSKYTISDEDYFDEDKEHVWNSFYCSKAAYEDDPHSFLVNNIRLHNIDSVGVSVNGQQRIVVGECSFKKTLYVGYRGSVSMEDWVTNARIGLSNQNNYQGKCHTGFKERADELPASYIVKYALEHNLSTIVTCGHSLGGAVSSVACLNLLSLPATGEVGGLRIFNITFAAPYFCDTQLSNYCKENKFSNRFFHYVNDEDIVPTLLSISNTITDLQKLLPYMSVSKEVKDRIEGWFSVFRKLSGIVANSVLPPIAAEFVENFLPIFGMLVEEKFHMNLGDYAFDDYKPMGNYRFLKEKVHYLGDESEVVQMMLGVATSMKNMSLLKKALEPHVMESYEKKMKVLTIEPSKNHKCRVIDDIFLPKIDKMEIVWRANVQKCFLSITGEYIHNLDIPSCNLYLTENFSVNEIRCTINKLELNKKERVTIEREVDISKKENIENEMNMPDMGIEFIISTTFGKSSFFLKRHMIREMKIRSLDEIAENVLVSDLLRRGIQRSIATKSEIDNNALLCEIENLVNRICKDKVNLQSDKFDVNTCTKNRPFDSLITEVESFFNQRIHKVIENKLKKPLMYFGAAGLGILMVATGGVAIRAYSSTASAAAAAAAALAAAETAAVEAGAKATAAAFIAAGAETITRIPAEAGTKIVTAVTGLSLFVPIQAICLSQLNTLAAAATGTAATAAAATMTATEAAAVAAAIPTAAAAATTAATAAVTGVIGITSTTVFTSAGIFGLLMKEAEKKAEIEAKYQQSLDWYMKEFCKIQGELELSPKEEEDLRDSIHLAHDESTNTPYAKEAVIVRLWHFWQRQNLEAKLKLPNSILEYFSNNVQIQAEEEKRLHCMESIHKIRVLFSSQCYVGFTGYEDSGKSTLLANILGRTDIETGYTSHTKKVNLYPVDDSLTFVDYPGTKGLEDHAVAFGNCGPMNNLIFFLMPFAGEPKEDTYQEIKEAFLIMKMSSSAQIFFCMNKCGAVMEDICNDPKCIDPTDTPFGKFRERFVAKLTKKKETEDKADQKAEDKAKAKVTFKIDESNFLFTDWKIGDTEKAKAAGIVGPNTIIQKINEFLKKRKVYEGREQQIPSILNISS